MLNVGRNNAELSFYYTNKNKTVDYSRRTAPQNQPPSWKSSSLSSVPLTDSSESSVLDILSETERKLNVSRNNTGLTFYYTNNEKTAVIPDAQRPTKNQPPS